MKSSHAKTMPMKCSHCGAFWFLETEENDHYVQTYKTLIQFYV
jgi:hypothetical protein